MFAEIASKEFVSVQPMNLPSGLIFYLDFKYGTNQSLQGGGSLFGGSSNAKLGSTDKAEGGLYGAGRHGYSINDKIVENVTTGQVIGVDVATDADMEGVRAFKVVAADGTESVLDGDNKAQADGTLHYHVATTAEARGDFEDRGTALDSDSGNDNVCGFYLLISELLKLTWNSKVNQSLQRHVS